MSSTPPAPTPPGAPSPPTGPALVTRQATPPTPRAQLSRASTIRFIVIGAALVLLAGAAIVSLNARHPVLPTVSPAGYLFEEGERERGDAGALEADDALGDGGDVAELEPLAAGSAAAASAARPRASGSTSSAATPAKIPAPPLPHPSTP